jgi:Kef-type K+ transport system membrane component KefB
VPLGLGSGAAVIFKSSFAGLGVHTGHAFVEFMGVAVAITALPVLAAILREHNIAGTRVGVTATAAAGIMDVAAWLLLAVAVSAATHAHGRSWLLTLLLISAFAASMLLVVRPVLGWWLGRPQAVLAEKLPIAMGLALGSAWVTASLGLHPVFGGFLAGLTLPRAANAPDADVLQPMEEISRALLPLFFMVTGLSVNIGALNGSALWLLALLCIIASSGKLVPAYLGARISGMQTRESVGVAVLVNTRGLTELIALNVGLTAGLLNETLFSVLVVMAVIMTVMTAPLLRLTGLSSEPVHPRWKRAAQPQDSQLLTKIPPFTRQTELSNAKERRGAGSQ